MKSSAGPMETTRLRKTATTCFHVREQPGAQSGHSIEVFLADIASVPFPTSSMRPACICTSAKSQSLVGKGELQ